MSEDRYLLSAGIASDWPYGRGCYVSVRRNHPGAAGAVAAAGVPLPAVLGFALRGS